MGISERKERDKQQMRSLILETAMKLFLEEGFDKVTIRRIAEKIEYSPGNIYFYFENKEEILYTLYLEGFEELYRRQQAIKTIEDPAKKLKKLAEIYFTFASEQPRFYELMFISSGLAKKIREKDPTCNYGLRSYNVLKEVVQGCMNAGVISKKNVDIVTFSLWSQFHGIVSLVIRERCVMFSDRELSSVMKKAMDLVFESIVKRR
jgi:AcrR family transcriptional regulator